MVERLTWLAATVALFIYSDTKNNVYMQAKHSIYIVSYSHRQSKQLLGSYITKRSCSKLEGNVVPQ